jgi:hypothetical protein
MWAACIGSLDLTLLLLSQGARVNEVVNLDDTQDQTFHQQVSLYKSRDPNYKPEKPDSPDSPKSNLKVLVPVSESEE